MDALIAAVQQEISTPTSDASSKLLPLLRAANSAHAGSFGPEIRGVLKKDDQKALLEYGVKTLTQTESSPAATPEVATEWITLMKIVARTQADLDALYSKQFILYLTGNIERYAAAAGDASTASSFLPLFSASLRLLMNLCIVSKERVHQAFGVAAGKNVPLFGRVVEKKAEAAKIEEVVDEEEEKASEPSAAEMYPGLLPFLAAYPRLLNSSTEPDAEFFFTRCLMFLLVHVDLAKAAIREGGLYEMVVEKVMRVSENERLGIVLRDQQGSSASASSSNSGLVLSPTQNVKLLVELFKLLANTSMLDDDLPTCQSHLTKSNPDLYAAYLSRLAALLAYGVEVPEEVKEGYKGDPLANESIGKLLPTSQAAAAAAAAGNEGDQAAVAVDQVRLEESSAARPATSTSVAGASASSSSSSSAHFQTAPAVPSAQYTPVQRQQTRLLLEQMSSESDNEFLQLLAEARKDASNMFLGVDGQAAIGLLEKDGCVAFHGLMQLLHRSLVLAGKNKKDGELLLSPILSTLSALIKTSPVLRAHAKRCLFLDLANSPKTVDGKPYKKADAQNYAMTPAGAVSEKIVDPDPLSLKALLMQWIITLNFSLKQNVSEFLYRVCDEDTSEYIRLLGFGNAIGLLAEKGLPGFAGMLKSKPVDMDAVLKSGKKL
jgi:hypothetical protein